MDERTTWIEKETRVIGSVESAGSLLIDGEIRGQRVAAHDAVTVGSSGVVTAIVQGHDVLVRGVIVGDIHASGAVKIISGAKVVGNITAPRVAVAAGARLQGKVFYATPAKVPGIDDAAGPMPTPPFVPLPAGKTRLVVHAAADFRNTTDRANGAQARGPVSPGRDASVNEGPSARAEPEPKS